MMEYQRKKDRRVGENDLSVACMSNNEELARSFIEKGADVNLRDKNRETPFMVACKNSNQEIVKLLVDSGADLLLKNIRNETCLTIHYAYAIKKNDELVKYLIEKEPRLVNEDKEFIFKVVKQNDFKTMEYLIEKNIDLDVQDIYCNITALMVSILNQKLEMAQVLIEHGANVYLADTEGNTALMFAVRPNNKQDLAIPIVKMMIENNTIVDLQNKKGETALMIAIGRENFEMAQVLIEHGANLNLANKDKNTALMVAFRYKRNLAIPIVKMMIKNNANVNLQNKKGETVLMLACEFKMEEIIYLLIEYGANVLLKNEANQTCLHYAYIDKMNDQLVKYLIEKEPRLINEDKEFFFEVVKQNDFQMVKYLVEHGINLNLTDRAGNTALMFAARNCSRIVELMIEKNINLNLQNHRGETALMIAISKEHFKTVQVLIEHGVNLNLADKEGITALMFAVRSKKLNRAIPIVKMMIEKNVDLNLQNKLNETALITALPKQNYEVSKDSCKNEKIQLIRLLVENGANLNVQDSEGKTPLMKSLERQYFKISEIFIDDNAELDLLDKNEESVWFYLCKFNSVKFIECQRRNKITNDEEIEAHKKCLEKLVQKSNLINKANNRGQIPLFEAIEFNSDQWIIELLIKKGADLSHRNKEGKTALYYAIKQNLIRVVELLIKNGADLNQPTNSVPYLYLACSLININSNICKLLIEKGINLHCQYIGKRVFHLLIKISAFIQSEKFKIYINALIKELSSTFSYSDYEEFRQRVIKSIDNEDIVLVDSDHLEALSLLSEDNKELEHITGHLKSLEFKERLIVDYLNVLGDQKELLEIRKIKLSAHFPELSQSFEQQQLKSIPKFGHPSHREKEFNSYFKLKDLFSEETFHNCIDLIESQENDQLKLIKFTNVIESIRKYIEIITFKTSFSNQLLEFVKSK